MASVVTIVTEMSLLSGGSVSSSRKRFLNLKNRISIKKKNKKQKDLRVESVGAVFFFVFASRFPYMHIYGHMEILILGTWGLLLFPFLFATIAHCFHCEFSRTLAINFHMIYDHAVVALLPLCAKWIRSVVVTR